jgi:choloylglycine hydrolase
LGSNLPESSLPKGIVSATQLTSASDLKEKVYYYHTMWNRQIRKIDLTKIDFSKLREQVIDDDVLKINNIKELTPLD